MPVAPRQFLDGVRECCRCRKVLPLSEFRLKKNRQGKYRPHSRCRLCLYEVNKAYFSSDAGKKAVSGQTKRKWRRVKYKVSSRNILNQAILDGDVEPGPCEVCGSKELTEAHHDDYFFPLAVRWLCKEHHMMLHGKRLAKPKEQYAPID